MLRFGSAPYLECSRKGDARFSAFCACIAGRGGRSVEEVYQGAKLFADGSTGLHWRLAKGRVPINVAEVRRLYAALWDEYVAENPALLPVLCAASGLSDVYGQRGHACQAEELWRIRCAAMNPQPARVGVRLLVCGGRDYADQEHFNLRMSQVDVAVGIDAVIEGFARGADTMARVWALANGRALHTYPADWGTWGPAAGPLRNRHMLEHGKPTLVLAFPGGRGTENMAQIAQRAGVTVWRA